MNINIKLIDGIILKLGRDINSYRDTCKVED